MLNETFDQLDETETWFVSDFAVAANWNQTAWEADYLIASPGEVTLTFDGTDSEGKDFTGSELQSQDFYGYGSYEVEMTAAGESGVVSSFFLFSDTFFGAPRHNEIDFEFLGDDTTKANINYYYGSENLGDNGPVQVDLGFDAADGMHTYRIDWHPDGIRWYADDVLLYEVVEETAPVPIPDEPMKIYMNIWTGGAGLENWHGPVAPDATAQATYSSVEFTPYAPEAPTDVNGAISFAGEDQAYVVNLADGSFARAARVLPIGDSLTVGFDDVTDPDFTPETSDGYRSDLFNHIVDGGGWIDYVGGLQAGPADMLDRDHAAVGGEALAVIVRPQDTSPIDLSVNLAAHNPDIVLLMAGTNDFNASNFFSHRFPNLINNMQKAIDQFYDYAGNAGKYLVISTLAPKTSNNVPAEYATFINEGYSIVNGTEVIGDAGNGTYVPGLRALITAQQAQHETLILFDNPVGLDDLSPDQVHFSDAGYAEYAQDIYNLLLAQIGQQDGSFGTWSGTLPVATDVIGGNAGDRITGDDANNVIFGGGGADYLTGGAGGDTFGYGVAALDGNRDYVSDLSVAEGDTLDLSAIVAHYGWSAEEFEAAVNLSEDADGTELALDTPEGLQQLAYFYGASAVQLADLLDVDPPDPGDPGDPGTSEQLIGTNGNDTLTDSVASTEILGLGGRDNLFGNGGNDILDGGAGRDKLYGGAGADVFRFTVETLDGNRDEVYDFSIAEGDKVDLSPIGAHYGWDAAELESALSLRNIDVGLRISITTPDGGYNVAVLQGVSMSEFLASDSLILSAGPPPDTGDDDGNMALSAPDSNIDADEAGTVQIVLSGLDADATAVVTLSAGGTDLTQNASADGTLVFDLSSLPDGPVTSSVTATDGSGNESTVSGPVLTLDTAPDLSADVDGNLTVIAPDADISANEVGSVTFNVTGIDADASAVVTVSDGTNSVESSPLAADGSVALDLSSLSDGTLTLSVTATDDDANMATVVGANLTLDTTIVTLPVLTGTSGNNTLTDGDGATEILGLGGRDNLFGNGGNDILDGGAGRDKLYGGAGADVFRFTVETLDGNRDEVYDFSIAEGDKVDLSPIGAHYGWDAAELESALSLRNIDVGLRISITTPDGGYNVAVLQGVSMSEFLASDSLILSAGPPPDTGDDDGNMALSAPDSNIDADEAGTVQIVLSGLDADATAVVTLSAGGTDLTQNASADGTLVFDLSSLPDGPVTSSVTATDGSGNESTVSGPVLTLDTAPDLSADVDGNLTVIAPDADISANEVGSVTFNVTGIDADASAVVTVSDGTNSVESSPLAADGSVALDLSSLSDGTLTLSVTATDDDANMATVVGANLTLDTTIVTLPVLTGTSGNNTLTDGDGATEILGLGGRDNLFGNGGNDILDGGAGRDKLYGGAGADVFRFTVETLDGNRDEVYDFSIAEGDKVDLSPIGAHYGWDAAELESALSLRNIDVGLRISITTPDGGYNVTVLQDVAMSEFLASDGFIL